jgi:DMSO reductase family type II enzyme molybdopterin subunit
MKGFTRRELLVASAAGSLALSLRRLAPPGTSATLPTPIAATPAYKGFQDVYREAWTWDRVVRGTHLRANCFASCAFDLYVKDGVVWREEQADVYSRSAPGLPDFAPRGCQKGVCYSNLMLNPDRITHPLERVGPRGSGRWRRTSWDQAVTRVADAMLDAIEEGGPETVVYDNGTSNVDNGPSSLGEMRLFSLLGATMLDGFGGTGDLAMGAVQTWGVTFVDGTADDWFRADTLIFWHCNPTTTRMPDVHFSTEARYNGTRVVTVSPDMSPSTIHASLWVNPRQGTDAALALGLARTLIEHGAIDADYVCEQTDLPFLVREDTGRFLRESDVTDGGKDDVFYIFDLEAGAIAKAPATAGQRSDSLELDGKRPALEGSFEVETLGGTMTVQTVMEKLRERLAAYTPEHVAQVTGVGPQTQQKLAEYLEGSQRFLIYATWGSNRGYHSDLLQRSLILLSALRGQHGRSGGGVRFSAWHSLSGDHDLNTGPRPSWLQRMILRFYTPPPRMMENAIAGVSLTGLTWMPSHLLLYLHGGLDQVQDDDAPDPTLPRAPREYLREALDRGWIPARPPPDRPPRVLLTSGVNPLRRWPCPQIIEKVLWPKLRMIVALDFRVSTTGMKADLLLPVAGYYEKRGIKYMQALSPYVVVGDQAVAPPGEAKGEWEIMSLLAKRLQEKARERGLEGDIANVYDQFSVEGRYGPEDDELALDTILRGATVTRDVGWKEALRAGAVPMRSADSWNITSAIGSSLEKGGTLTPSRIHVEGKHAWPTLTGRQQFYLDHPWFFEADEVLPRWKPLPRPGGEHPIRLIGSHNRWSIHAIWRTHPDLLRLQRGEPLMWISVEDARARSIPDGALVRAWNDHGEFRVRVKVAPVVGAGQAFIDHAWEPYQFPDWKGNMEVVSSPYKPVHFVGDYGHIRYRVFQGGPMHAPQGTPIDIELDRPSAEGRT